MMMQSAKMSFGWTNVWTCARVVEQSFVRQQKLLSGMYWNASEIMSGSGRERAWHSSECRDQWQLHVSRINMRQLQSGSASVWAGHASRESQREIGEDLRDHSGIKIEGRIAGANLLGRGDPRTKKGKIFKGSYGKIRPKAKKRRLIRDLVMPSPEEFEHLFPIPKTLRQRTDQIGLPPSP